VPRSRSGVSSAASAWTGGVVSRGVLFERLRGARRVSVVSAPAGSGKTFLLRSWIRDQGLEESAACVSVLPDERDGQRFWLSVLDALRGTTVGSTLVRALSAAPDLDCWAVVEGLLEDLDNLREPAWLVIDDLHELESSEALRQLELLVLRSPAELRFALLTRQDLRLGLHRLRLEGELTEIRASDFRFGLDEARALFEAASVRLSDSALMLLVERTEGWAAGLRLAALSLAGHPDPDRFAAEFSGSERTVAEYLLAEVLDRQPDEVRRLLLRTSVLERVSGPLADLLTGNSGGEGILQELEDAGAFVVSLDARRSWFRYHRLFAELLQLELRRTESAELLSLHALAAEWLADHEYPIEAARHAQAAEKWSLAARLLSDHWFAFVLNGQAATAHELLTGFPARVLAADRELTALMAADQLNRGSLEESEHQLALAIREPVSEPADGRERLQVLLAVLRLSIARQRSNLPAVVDEAQRLLAPTQVPAAAQLGLGEDLRALALINLGIAELWAARVEDADRHLEQGVALAQRIERPYLEIDALAHWAILANVRSFALAMQRADQAIELARRHGWSDEPVAAFGYAVLGRTRLWQGQVEDAERLLARAERTLPAEIHPAAGLMLHYARGVLEMARGRYPKALVAFRAAERLAELLVTPHTLATRMRSHLLQLLVKQGDTQRAEQILAELDEQQRESGEMRIALAALRLAQDDPRAASAALSPVVNRSAPLSNPRVWLVHAFLLEAIAHDALGDTGAAARSLEQALQLAESDGLVLAFLLHPAPGLLERHRGHHTSHAALISEILNRSAGNTQASLPAEPLSERETRVLRYLPTNLSKQEIADELYVSVHTVKTHIHHIYTKLGVHRRWDAVERARALGLLAPSLHKR
jgi:LuxR family transcriptional regulator, maltose regulon positive regulatory protein